VWSCEALREQFLALPYPAVRCLLDSSLTAVATENTALVALTGWVEEGPHGRSTTSAQRKELLSLVSPLVPMQTCAPVWKTAQASSSVASRLPQKQTGGGLRVCQVVVATNTHSLTGCPASAAACYCCQVRLPYLTSSFVGDILLAVPWIRDALDNRQLLNAFQ
jgi:hypothetical protein